MRFITFAPIFIFHVQIMKMVRESLANDKLYSFSRREWNRCESFDRKIQYVKFIARHIEMLKQLINIHNIKLTKKTWNITPALYLLHIQSTYIKSHIVDMNRRKNQEDKLSRKLHNRSDLLGWVQVEKSPLPIIL